MVNCTTGKKCLCLMIKFFKTFLNFSRKVWEGFFWGGGVLVLGKQLEGGTHGPPIFLMSGIISKLSGGGVRF